MTDGDSRKGVTQLVGLGVLLAVLMVGVTIVQGYALRASFNLWVAGQEARNIAIERKSMQYVETKWRSGGTEQVVRTEVNPGETPEALVIRHKALVDAMQAPGKFPKDP